VRDAADAGSVASSGEQPEVGKTFVHTAGETAAVPPADALVYAPPEKPPLLVSSPSVVAPKRAQGSMGMALVAGAGVALAGGLVWAGVVIATRYDVGFLAWFVGAATGTTVFRI
jgi:hypothetical protein